MIITMSHVFKGDHSKLDNEQRRREFPPDQILKQAGVKPGDTVIDFGAGIGYFAIPAARMVGKAGTVYAIDFSEGMIKAMRRKSRGLVNIEILQQDYIPDTPSDIILGINILHEVSDPQLFIDDCKKYLKEGGSLTIIDWHKKVTGQGPPVEKRISKDEAIAMLGAKYEDLSLENKDYYFLKYTK
jgi:ubiquinone/menaquinone biosynthesis C-methylase UbiE